MNVRLSLSDPSVKELARASCAHERYYDALPKLQGEANWQEWSDALQHAALMAGTDAVLNGELKHPQSLEGQQSTTSEWNDNVRRTAIWRSRNESLLKAMRNTSDVDFDDLGGLNACRTYLGLKSKYHITDHQRAFDIFSTELTEEYIELTNTPREAADRLQEAFDRYNHLAGCEIKQRLPENFLKLIFLDSLDPEVYGDLRKALLKDYNVLALDQGSALTFNELVDLVIDGHNRLLQEQADSHIPKPATSSQQCAKRNISQVDGPAPPDLHAPCSLPYHKNAKHTNQKCKTQNPRLRPKNWTASVQDQEYLAEHPEIENPYSNDSSSDDSGSDESDSEAEDVERSKPVLKANGSWRDTAVACYKEVKAQIDVVTAGFNNTSNIPRKYPTLRGDLTGEWLLYSKGYNPGTGGKCHMRLWSTTSKNLKRLHPDNQRYKGKLSIGRCGKVKMFDIAQFSPPHHVTGRCLQIIFSQSGRKSCDARMTFWGDGKMLVTIPALVTGDQSGKTIEFAGLKTKHALRSAGARAQTKPDSSDDSGESGSSGDSSDDEERYDRVIRTDRQVSVAIKVEEDENTARVRGAEEAIADKIATTIGAVQKQKDMVGQRVIVPLHAQSGKWCLHSAKYRPGLNKDTTISFYAH
ncbi:hypothetical protein KCU95_g14364, partial [Aureobasidium melanogenum]